MPKIKKPTLRQKAVLKTLVNATQAGLPCSVGQAMVAAGYKESTAHNPEKNLLSKPQWAELLAGIDDAILLDKLKEIASDSSDKRACLQAIDMSLKLKDRYPKAKTKIVGIFNKITSLEE